MRDMQVRRTAVAILTPWSSAAPAPSSDTMAEQLAGEPLSAVLHSGGRSSEHWRNNCSACAAVAESLGGGA